MMNAFHAVVLATVASCASSPTMRSAPVAVPASRAVTMIEVPVPPGSGDAREVRVLLDAPELKLASITLRRGTVLPEHAAPMPVTLVAVSGGGTVTVGEQRLRLDPAHLVFLAANTPHAVEPDPGSDLVVLVHHLRAAGAQP